MLLFMHVAFLVFNVCTHITLVCLLVRFLVMGFGIAMKLLPTRSALEETQEADQDIQ